MIILAQDPSFTKLAFSLYDGKETIYLDNCDFSLGECVGFEKIFNANREIMKQYLTKLVRDYKVNETLFIDKIFSEIPPPNGMYSAGLFSLDTYVLDKLFTFNKQCDEIWTIPPSFLMTVHNIRKYNKKDSTTLAKYYMGDVLKNDLKFVIRGTMNADKAESLFFLLRAFCKYDTLGLKGKIVNTISGFFSETEKLLISRKI
jgi:hypothetical protein